MCNLIDTCVTHLNVCLSNKSKSIATNEKEPNYDKLKPYFSSLPTKVINNNFYSIT